MKKYILLIALLLFSQNVYADLLSGDNYVSPERYAVNEADMQIDYSNIPSAPKIDIDKLDDIRFQAPNLVEKDFAIGHENQNTEEIVQNTNKKVKKQKVKKQKTKKEKEVIGDDEAYKKKLSYKIAKWWVDKRYEREEPHHGTLHEIKVQKRIDYENRLEEEAREKEAN